MISKQNKMKTSLIILERKRTNTISWKVEIKGSIRVFHPLFLNKQVDKVLFYKWISTIKCTRNDRIRMLSLYSPSEMLYLDIDSSPIKWKIGGKWIMERSGWPRCETTHHSEHQKRRDTQSSHASWCHTTGRTHQVCSPKIKPGPIPASRSNRWLTGRIEEASNMLNPGKSTTRELR